MAQFINTQVMAAPSQSNLLGIAGQGGTTVNSPLQPYGSREVTPTFQFHAKLAQLNLEKQLGVSIAYPPAPNYHHPGTIGPWPLYSWKLDLTSKRVLGEQMQGRSIPTTVPIVPPSSTYTVSAQPPKAIQARNEIEPAWDRYSSVMDAAPKYLRAANSISVPDSDHVFESCDMVVHPTSAPNVASMNPGVLMGGRVQMLPTGPDTFTSPPTFNSAAHYNLDDILGPDVLIEPVMSRWEYNAVLRLAQCKYKPNACVLIGKCVAIPRYVFINDAITLTASQSSFSSRR